MKFHLFKNRSRLPLFISLAVIAVLGPAIFLYSQYAKSAKADWYNSSWSYRKELVFNNAASSTNLTDFPVMVKLTSSNFTFSQAQSAGQDIRFTDSDGTTLLDYEIEKFDTIGSEAIIWVKVPQIDTTSTTDSIYLYWGNGAATDAQDADNTWNANYKGVYHLNDNAANGNVLDSSGNSNTITSNENTNSGSHLSSGILAGSFVTAANPVQAPHDLNSGTSELYPDAVFDSSNHPVVAYHDNTNGNLIVVHCNERHCKGNDESVTTPDTSGDTGEYPSITIDSNGYPVIAHYDNTNGNLRLTHCDDANCVGTETTNAVDSTGTVGIYPSLALDSNNYPIIAYHDTTNTNLKLAHCNDLYCAGGDESIVTLDGTSTTVGGLQNSISLVLDGSGYPVLSYYDGTNTNLIFLHCNDANCTGGDDTPTTLVNSANDVGRHTDLILDSSGFPMIVYEDWSGRDTYYIHCDDANCAGGNDTPVLIDSVIADYPSIEVTSAGIPLIVYSSNLAYTRIAVCSTSACTSTTQNYLTLTNQYGSSFASTDLASDDSLLISNYNRGKYDGIYDVSIITTDRRYERVYDSDFDFGTGSFSISAWFKTAGINKTQEQYLLNRYDDDQGFKAYLNYSGQPCFAIDDDTSWGPDDYACGIPSNYYQNVDNGNAANPQAMSMVLDSNSYPVFVYYDVTDTALEFVHCNDRYCQGNDESYVSLDSTGTVGQYPSLVLDSSGYPVISYYDATNTDIKVIHCGNANCSSGNNTNIADASATTTSQTSLKLDSNGYPVIAYHESTGADLRFTHCNDVNCAGSNETTLNLDTTNSVGLYPSLELDSLGYPVISYHDGTALDLKLIHCGDANCSAGNSINIVDSTGQAGYYTNMKLDSSGYPVIAHFYNNATQLKLAHCNDANCAGSNENLNVAFSDFDGGVQYITLQLNASGFPVILHTSLGFSTQIFTTCNDANCAGSNETHNFIREDTHNQTHGTFVLDSSGYPVILTRSGLFDLSITRPEATSYVNTNTVDDGQWHHMVGVKNGTSSITLYVDGVAVATDSAIAATSTLTSNSATLNLAEELVSGLSTNGFGGYLDEVQIDNTARSSDWVKAQYLSESNNFINVKFTQYGAIANTLANFTNNSSALKNDLVGYYKFDEGNGSTTYNSGSTQSSNNAIITGATWSLNGKYDKCLSFSGGTNVVTVQNAHNSIKSISFWINPNSTTESILELNGTSYVTINSGTITTTGITSPTIYVNKIQSSQLLAGIWQHVIITSNTAINGSSILFGRANGTSLNGLLDDIKIYSDVLSVTEVTQDFNQKSSMSFGGISDTSNLTGGDVASRSASATYCVPGASDTCTAPLAHWKFEEATWTNDCSTETSFDSSGHNLNLKSCPNSTGPSTSSVSHYGRAPSLDGSDDYFESTNTIFDITGAITLEAWVKPTAISVNDDYVINRTNNNSGYSLGWASTMQPKLRIGNGTAYTDLLGTSTLALDTWYHLVGTVDASGNAKIYVNGKIENTGSLGILAAATQNLRIGTRSTGNELAALVDEIKIFTYERIPSQVSWDYDTGSPIAFWKMEELSTPAYDSSGNSNHLTWNNNVTYTTGKFNNGTSYDGVDDFLSCTDVACGGTGKLDFAAGSNFSYGTWFKTSVSGTPKVLMGKKNTALTAADAGYILYMVTSDVVRCVISDGTNQDIVSTTNTYADNIYHHAMCVVSNNQVELYIDGKLATSTSLTATGSLDNSSQFRTGVTGSGATDFSGSLDSATVFNYALTSTQIKMLYNQASAIRFGP